MRAAAKVLAPLALAATIVPSILFLTGTIGEGPMKTAMLVATIVWFVTAPFWMKGGNA